MTRSHRRALVAACGVLLVTGACSRKATPKRPVVVFAAASLRDVFNRIGAEFERAHPDLDVLFNFAGSQELKRQLLHGAPADVFASADEEQMAELSAERRVQDPVFFATNELSLVFAKQADQGVSPPRELRDVLRASRVVMGAPEVPIGRYTLALLERAAIALDLPDFRARVEAKVVSRELNVRQVLAKVVLGEADAGFVYATDARSAGDRVHPIPIPETVNVVTSYPIAIASEAKNPRGAEAWVAWVRSERARRSLTDAGFRAATAIRRQR